MRRISLRRHERRARRTRMGPLANILDPIFYADHYDDTPTGTDAIYQHFEAHGLQENRHFNRWHSPAYVRRYENQKSLHGVTATQAYFESDLHTKPRLLFVSHDATRTGAPAIILRLLKMFSETGAFECFSLLDADGERLHEFEEYSHTYVMSHERYDAEYSDDDRHAEISALLAPTGPFERNRPLCALVNSAESFHIGRSLARLGLPVMQLLHEFASYYPENRFQEIFQFSDKVIFPSHFIHKTAAQYSAIDETKVVVRGQGLLDDAFGQMDRAQCRLALRQDLNLSEDARIILNVGTRDQRKGIDLFVHTALAYFERCPGDQDTHFVWYGRGKETPGGALELALRILEKSDLKDRVRLMPSTNRIEQIFLGGDAFLLTARADPFPCVIHEAMACGLPVIAFRDGGGAQELIGDTCGSLVDMGDVVAMAEVIERYTKDPQMGTRQGETGKETIARDWQYKDYFRDVGRVLEQQLPDGTPWPQLTVPDAPGHLIVMPARLKSLQTCGIERLIGKGLKPQIRFLDGRFSEEADACIAACRKMGIAYEMAQPLFDQDLFRQLVLDSVMREPRPKRVTLVDTVQFVSPPQMSVFAYPIEIIETGQIMPAQRLGHYLPYVDRMQLADETTVRRVAALYAPMKDKVQVLNSAT